jgi:hypothetical protein
VTNTRLPSGNSWFHSDAVHFPIFMELHHSVNLKRLIRVPNLCGARVEIRPVQQLMRHLVIATKSV